jgi:hypothetical protein
MNTTKISPATTSAQRSEPTTLVKRVGSTTFVVSIRFNEFAKETLDDKILRLIEREVQQC